MLLYSPSVTVISPLSALVVIVGSVVGLSNSIGNNDLTQRVLPKVVIIYSIRSTWPIAP